MMTLKEVDELLGKIPYLSKGDEKISSLQKDRVEIEYKDEFVLTIGPKKATK